MDREKFMQEARLTAQRILAGKENGIMNLVQQAWAEGKRNAEVETLKQAVVEAFTCGTATVDKSYEVGYEEPVYPTWYEWLNHIGVLGTAAIDNGYTSTRLCETHIPADIAEKLGIEPKEG